MTIVEKKDAIENACLGRDCPNCPLYPFDEDCYGRGEADEVVERNINLLVKAGWNKGETTPDTTAKPVHDNVNHPSHYTQGGMECIDEMLLIFGKEAVKNFCICNAWKYRKRAMFKNGQEDIDKSDWYINKYKELSADGTAIR